MAWVKPQVEAWTHGVRVLIKIVRNYLQSFKLKWQYLKRTVPRVGTLTGHIEEALREKFFHALFRVEGRSRPNFGNF